MKSSLIFFIIIGLPLLIFIWHSYKTGGHRPDGYQPIKDQAVIPAVVIDVDMPFASMVVFLFKLALAAIPAILLLAYVLMIFYGTVIAGILPMRY